MVDQKTSKRLGVGCGILALMFGVFLCVVGYYGYRIFSDLKADARDPLPRALEILGTDALPDGYYANIAMSVPLFMDTVILSDKPNDKDQNAEPLKEGKGFLYSLVKVGKEKDSEALEAFFTGKSDDMSALEKNHLNISSDPKDVLARGILTVKGTQVRYLTTMKGFKSEQAHAEGLTTFMMIQCPNSEKVRFGVWFSELKIDPKEPLDLKQTVADEAMIEAFLGHFNFCVETN